MLELVSIKVSIQKLDFIYSYVNRTILQALRELAVNIPFFYYHILITLLRLRW